MNRTLLKTVVTLIILIILLVLFLEFLNVKLSGVPIYDKMKIGRNQLVYVKSKSSKINKEFIPKIQDLKTNEQFVSKCGFQESGFYHMVYRPDIFGFRDNDEKLYQNTDIVMIGDSFSFSTCINKPYDLKSQLEKISKKKILNLSISGSGPKRQMEVVRKITTETNFDYFIWIFYEGNDFDDLIFEKKKEGLLPNTLLNKEKYLTKVETIEDISPKDKLIWDLMGERLLKSKKDIIVDYNKLIKLHKKFPEENILSEHKWQNKNLVKLKIFLAERLRGLNSLIKYFRNYPKMPYNKEYDRVVNKMNTYLSKKKLKKKYIYYLPKYTRLTHKKINHPEVENLNQIKKLVKLTANKYNFEFIDGADFFHKRKVPLDIFHYKLPTHFNENGYKLEAEHINSFISKYNN